MSALWNLITSQFDSANLFQTVCFIVMLIISLPTLMLDRIVRIFETHRRIKAKYIDNVQLTSASGKSTQLDGSAAADILADYSDVKFVQKRLRVADPAELPVPRVTFKLTSGELVALYPVGSDIDITRTDKRGQAVVSYWARGSHMRERLAQLAGGVAVQ